MDNTSLFCLTLSGNLPLFYSFQQSLPTYLKLLKTNKFKWFEIIENLTICSINIYVKLHGIRRIFPSTMYFKISVRISIIDFTD